MNVLENNCLNRFANTFISTAAVGLLTSIVVLNAGITGNPYIWSLGNFMSGVGNSLFLIGSNIVIGIWGWQQRLQSVIALVLGIDLLVWLSVKGIKLLQISPWYLRPNGGTGGFPSGHATHAFAMAFLLTLIFPRASWLWYSVAAAISWSRVETEWHTGVQVAAGIILGISIAAGMISRWLKHPETAILKTMPPVPTVSAPANKVVAAD